MNQGWYHKKNLYNWAESEGGMAAHLSTEDYPSLWAQVKKRRLSRTALGVLKILFEHGPNEPMNPMTRAVTKRELADRLGVQSDCIADAVNRINTLVVQGAREGTIAKQWGLIWRNHFGVGIHPGLDDLERAKSISAKQIAGQTATWSRNAKIAAEAKADEAQAFARQIAAMSPEQRRALMQAVRQSASATA